MFNHNAVRRPFVFLFVFLFVCAATVQAATFAVPKDRDFIRQADAIVVATALESYTRLDEDGAIDTVTRLSLEEIIKGPISGTSLDIHEPGGRFGNRISIIHGVPRFEDGERVLLFLINTRYGWRVRDLALGKFTFVDTEQGTTLLMREETEISGWNADGTAYRIQRRAAEPFLRFVRAEAKESVGTEDYFVTDEGKTPIVHTPPARKFRAAANATPRSYTTFYSGAQGARWNSFPSAANFFTIGANAAAITATNTAMASWNGDAGSNVNLVNAGADTTGTHDDLGVNGADGQSSIMFEVNMGQRYGAPPFSCGANSYGGLFGIGGITGSVGTHTGPGGELFDSATEGDVDMNQGVSTCASLPAGDFASAVVHELGHALGFRHADQTRDFNSSAACGTDATLDCTNASTALMKAFIPAGKAGALQPWDITAVQAVYPTPAVVAPTNAPAGVTATAILATSVQVTWGVVTGATDYDIERSANNSSFSNVGSVTGNGTVTFTDASAAANTAYMYRVRGRNTGGNGPFSASDLATTVIFTDTTLSSSIFIKAVHITQLRTAVNAVRTLAGQAAFAFTDPTITAGSTKAKAAHVTDLRTALNAARSTLALSALSYTDPTITVGSTRVKAVHLTELRNGVK